MEADGVEGRALPNAIILKIVKNQVYWVGVDADGDEGRALSNASMLLACNNNTQVQMHILFTRMGDVAWKKYSNNFGEPPDPATISTIEVSLQLAASILFDTLFVGWNIAFFRMAHPIKFRAIQLVPLARDQFVPQRFEPIQQNPLLLQDPTSFRNQIPKHFEYSLERQAKIVFS